MRILVFSDLQADEGSERRRTDPSTLLQQWRVTQFYRWATQLIRTRKLDAVWDLGDTTHSRTALSHPVVQTVARGCAELTSGLPARLCIKLIGNHEQHMRKTDAHVGDIFSPYFHVVAGRKIIRLTDENLTLICAAYDPDIPRLEDWLHRAIQIHKNPQGTIIVLGHFPVSGAKLHSGAVTDGVRLDVLRGASVSLLGHVHRRQQLRGNIWYVGSPFQQDFGEANDPIKCVAIFDTQALTIEWVATPFPKYRTVGVRDIEQAAAGDDILKVVIRSTDEAQQYYSSSVATSVQPVYAIPEKTGQETPSADLDFTNLVEAYVKTVPLNSTHDISAGELAELAEELRHSAR